MSTQLLHVNTRELVAELKQRLRDEHATAKAAYANTGKALEMLQVVEDNLASPNIQQENNETERMSDKENS